MTVLNFLDLETTGFKADKGDRIVEVAMLLAELETGREYGRIVYRVNPERSMPEGAFNVHGISAEALKSEPKWGVVAPKIVRLLEKTDVLVAHNMNFDGPFMATELMRIKQPVPDMQTFCTMEAGRWACPTGKNPTLGELCWALGIEYNKDEAHAAMYDVLVMKDAFFKGRTVGKFQLEGE